MSVLKYSFLALFAAMLIASPVQAGDLDKDVAVVNIQKIMHDAKVAQSARSQLQAKQKEFQEEIGKKETELQKEDQELAKQRTILSQEAFQKQVDAFRKKAAETQKDVREKRAALGRAYDKTLADIQKQVMDIIETIAKERGFKMAIPSSQVLFYDGNLDISDEVLKRLDQKMPSITVQF